jgi:hypothetical protein
MCILGESVHYHKDGIIPFRQWKALNKVHRDILPSPKWNRKRQQKTGTVDIVGV